MGKKILLADDSITIQKVIELTFSDEDFDVVTVGNGRLAIEKAQEIRPDIVLCDIIMPEKDGYEVCEFIKKTPGLQGIPVLLLTGAFEPFDQERAARVGSDGYLAKPFEPETLIAKVKDLLSRAAARPAASAPPARPSPPTSSSAIPFAPPAREGESPRTASSPIPPLTVVPPRPPEPIPFPRVAPPEPPKAAMPPPASSVSFIPEEPFEDLDAGSFLADDDPATARPSEQGAFQSAADELLPMTAEESESLGVPDSASTVMFKADQVSWQAPPPVAAPPAAPPVMAAPPPAPEPELPSEATVFEEVIEEDVEFGGVYSPPPVYLSEPAGRFEAPPPPVVEPPRPPEPPPTASFRPVARPFEPETVEIPSSVPAVSPSPSRPPASGPPASRPPASRPPASRPPASRPPAATPLPPVVSAPVPPPVVAPPPAFARPEPPPASAPPMPTVAVAPPWLAHSSPEPEAFLEPEPEPVAPPAPSAPPPAPPVAAVSALPAEIHAAPVAWVPSPSPEPPAPKPSAESFADLVPAAAAEATRAPSEAAGVAVPVEMVEKIAQRVVAQISEKVVREIAWDVIPDLAEALIKAEIERLKAELQRI